MAQHQGGKLTKIIEQQSRSKEQLARLAGISKGSFFSYLKMEKIPSEKLEKICRVMGIDYIKEFVMVENPANEVKEPNGIYGLSAIAEALKSENEALKGQVETLKEMVEMLKRKHK